MQIAGRRLLPICRISWLLFAIRRARVEGLNSIATQLKVDGKQIINYTDSLHNSEDGSFHIAVSLSLHTIVSDK